MINEGAKNTVCICWVGSTAFIKLFPFHGTLAVSHRRTEDLPKT
jgi:hypothetical protein